MTIAIDWDLTWTTDAEMWTAFVGLAQSRGWNVIIVTGRRPEEPVGRVPEGVRVIYTSGRLKRPACEAEGTHVDIWVDDEPGWIEPCRELPESTDEAL